MSNKKKEEKRSYFVNSIGAPDDVLRWSLEIQEQKKKHKQIHTFMDKVATMFFFSCLCYCFSMAFIITFV